MSKVSYLFIVCLFFLACGGGCSDTNTIAQTSEPVGHSTPAPNQGDIPSIIPEIQETQPASSTYISNLIGDILSQPNNYTNQQVEIIGYYRGWDLLKEVQGAPPVTRSDWVIADQSGAIYVTGISPEKLNPSSQQDIWMVVRLVAIVKTNQNGVYLQAQSVEVTSLN